MSKIKAVIWDMDGVIIDTEGYWPQAERAVFTLVGVPAGENFENTTTGLRIPDVVRFWYDRYPWDKKLFPLQQLEEKIINSMAKFIKKEGKALPHIYEAFSFFHSKGLAQSIASSSPPFLIKSVIKKLKIELYITSFSSGEEEKLGKPAPDVYLTAARKLNINPLECLVIEDSHNGALAGHNAGMKVVVVTKNPEQFKDIPNITVISSLLEICTGMTAYTKKFSK